MNAAPTLLEASSPSKSWQQQKASPTSSLFFFFGSSATYCGIVQSSPSHSLQFTVLLKVVHITQPSKPKPYAEEDQSSTADGKKGEHHGGRTEWQRETGRAEMQSHNKKKKEERLKRRLKSSLRNLPTDRGLKRGLKSSWYGVPVGGPRG